MNDEEITAYHEAGHVVVNRHYHIPVTKVTIIPNDDDNSAGHAIRKTPNGLDNMPDKRLRKYITGTLAGYEAVKILGQDPNITFRDDTDERNAFYLVFDYLLDDNGNYCHRWVKMDIATLPENQRKSYPKGQKTVEGQEMTEEGRELIERFRKDAHDILVEKWDQVELLAKALLIKKTLSARDIKCICN